MDWRRHVREPKLRRRWIVGAGTAGLTAVPLIGTLGYESSFLLSPLFSILAVAVAVDTVRSERARERSGITARLGHIAARGAIELGTLLGICLAILVIAQLWQRNCDPWRGSLFFLIGPVASATLGFVAGLWGGVAANRRSRQLACGLAPLALSLAIGLWRLFANPVVFAFDPFWGYFSGAIYDEAVGIGNRYLWFRTYNALAAAGATLLWTVVVSSEQLTLAKPCRTPACRVRAVAAGLCVAGALSFGIRADHHGFTATTASIERALSATMTTEHFVIHYVPRSPTHREIQAVAAEHEFAWHRLESILGRAPDVPVHSFVFVSPDQKRVLMGAGRVEVAAPWRGHIYLNHQPFPHPVLHHELAHVFAGTMGDAVFGLSLSGLNLNLGLVEGVATALAPRPRNELDLHDQAVVLDRLGKRPPLGEIMGPGFWAKASRHAYTAAGSFCAYLLDEHGVEPLAALYRSAGDFDSAYGSPLGALEDQWVDFLRRRNVRDEDVDALAQRFKVRPVFLRPCAHRAANLLGTIRLANAQGKTADAVEGYETLCNIEPERPAHRIGLADALARDGRFAAAGTVLDEAQAMEDLTVTIESLVLERRGDVALHLGDLAGASAAFSSALALPMDQNRRRVLQLKKIGSTDPAMTQFIVEYFAAYDIETNDLVRAIMRLHLAAAIQATPGYGSLGSYLVGRQLLNAQKTEHAMHQLERALQLAPGTSLPSPEFVRAARFALLTAYAATGRHERARKVIADLEAEPGLASGDALVLGRWRERVEFLVGYRPPAG